MFNKRDFMKKVKKNRILVLVISVIVISGVYHGVQKAIDVYNFDSDIVFYEDNELVNETQKEEEGKVKAAEEKNWFEKLFGGGEDLEEDVELEETEGEVFGQIAEDEVDLEIEEVGDGEGEEGSVDEEDLGEVLDTGESSSVDELQKKIYVYITGEVNVPGVVILNKGSRIVDAINAAGGTTVKANVTKVNLVYVLEDGMKVNIPNSNDLKNNPDFEYITMNSGDGADDAKVRGDSDANYSESNSGVNPGSANNYSIVNINTATQTELESLPGIGPSLALKIINYRKENGKFSSIEEIKNVSGIGDSKFESLKRYIKV